MPDTYAILGSSHDTETPTVLYTSESYTEADRWRDGYTRWGNWGGYDSLDLYEIGPDQTADSIHMHDSPIDSLERDDLSSCDICDKTTPLDDLGVTECSRQFCGTCGSDGHIKWTSCDELGEEWAHLA